MSKTLGALLAGVSVAAGAAAAGCGIPLTSVDVRPAPEQHGPLSVRVTGVAAPTALFQPGAESAGDGEVPPMVVVELELYNGSPQPLTPYLKAFRLVARDAFGREVTGTPLGSGSGRLPIDVFRGAGAVWAPQLAPGTGQRVWVAFTGIGGPRRTRLTGLTLVAPGAPQPLSLRLLEPAVSTPRLVYRAGPSVLALRTGLAGVGESEYMPMLDLELLRAWRAFVLGTSVANGVLFPLASSTSERRTGLVFAIGPKIGWLSRATGVGLLGDVSGGWASRRLLGSEPDAPEGKEDALVLRVSAAVRLSIGDPVGMAGAVLPGEHAGPSPFRSWTVDIGYAHWFSTGDRLGGGVIFMVGAPLVTR